MNSPDISVSMHDAANTRENDTPDICEECDQYPESCGCEPGGCEEAYEQEAAEDAWEGAREARE